MVTEAPQGTLEDREDAGPGKAGVVRFWLNAIDLAQKKEEHWRNTAKLAYDRYRLESNKRSDMKATAPPQYNILYSNIQTLAPAVYNSQPVPDVRRRYVNIPDENNPQAQLRDNIAKTAAQVIERALTYNIDSYDFDAVMRGVTRNGLLQGRGVPRIRYMPRVDEDDEAIEAQELRSEIVAYDRLLVAPADTWDDVPAIYFEHHMTKDELEEAFGEDKAKNVTLDITLAEVTDEQADAEPSVFKRARVWEVWDRDERQVLFISPSFKDEPLHQADDPLNLTDYWPVPRPFRDVPDPDDVTPVTPYELYRPQAMELDILTGRINRLVKILKWRGVYWSQITAFGKIKDGEDGDLEPTDQAQQLLDAGGLDRAVWLMPIEQLITTVRELIVQREAVKQTVFEITGVSDIIRGASDPRETLGAQRIKSQFGTLRLQERQDEIQRIARDVFRMKAEIIAEHFDVDTLEQMTGIQLPRTSVMMIFGQPVQLADPTQPTWEQVMDFLRTDFPRNYLVDVETDSTIRGDLGYFQENAARFVEGLGVFLGAVGPAVQSGAIPRSTAAVLLQSFSRQFKLGKAAEDALDELTQEDQQQPDPAQMALAQAQQQQAQAEQQRNQLEFAKIQLQQAELVLKAQESGQQLQFDTVKLVTDTEVEREKIASKEQIEADKRDTELIIAETRGTA